METTLKDTLKYYCEKEIEMFVSSSIYSKLSQLVKSLNLNLKLEFGNAKEEKDKNLYLSIEVFNDKNEAIEIFDEGFLTTSTMLVMVGKKDSFKFFSWQDDEFIEDLNWIINHLENYK